MKEPEVRYCYPHEWVEEYRRTGTVQRWHDDYPKLIDRSRGAVEPKGDNTTSNLSTYALMYLLKRDEGLESLTYFRLTAESKKDKRKEDMQKLMRRWMGNESFEQLRTAIRAAKLTKGGFEGEPDLFCWNPNNHKWFFAEAKGDDKLTETQQRWFTVCRATLPGVIIKVCRVKPLAIGQTHVARKP